MRLPLRIYWAHTSARVPQAMHGVHSVVSWAWPSASFQRTLVATLNVVRAVPVAVYHHGVLPKMADAWHAIQVLHGRSSVRFPVSNRESSIAFRKAKMAKTGVNGARAREAQPDVF